MFSAFSCTSPKTKALEYASFTGTGICKWSPALQWIDFALGKVHLGSFFLGGVDCYH
jgi:hypothetical protein